MSVPAPDIPCLVARDAPQALGERVVASLTQGDLVGALVAALSDSGEAWRSRVRSTVRSLIDEGRRYADTPDGRRWAAILHDAPAVQNGWLLWNHANVDFYVRNAEPLADSPAELFGLALAALGRVDAAELLGRLGALSAELDAGVRAPRAAGAHEGP